MARAGDVRGLQDLSPRALCEVGWAVVRNSRSSHLRAGSVLPRTNNPWDPSFRERAMKKLFTIGYEGSTAENLLATLENVGVEVLADVRELPLSRKKGLSKTSLSQSLAERNIGYQHFKMLGDPKPGRDAAKSGNYAEFERIFLKHLATQGAQEALGTLLGVAERKVTCLLCFERCASVCHRSYLADFAVQMGFEVYNLVSDSPEKYLKNGAQVPRYNPRQSLTAAE